MANCGQLSDGTSPTLTNSGLNNNGQTASYTVQYDDTITSSAAQTAFETFRANCDGDFAWMQGLFNNASSPWSGRMGVNILSGPNATSGSGTGACWPNLSGPITLYPGVPANNATATVDPFFLRYLLVSEVVEMFMQSTGSDWYGGNWASGNEGSAGEGLSRFIGAQLLIQKDGAVGGEPGYAVANQWMNSPRTDFVNAVNPSDNSIDPVIGCACIFVYYLYTQLGCPIPVITGAGAQQLSGVYSNITGDGADPFPYFKNLIDIGFPGTATITSGNLDNPWPIAPMKFVGVKATLGLDETKDILNTQGGLIPGAFTLWIEGLSRAGFASLNIQPGAFSGNFATLPGVTISPSPIGPQFESGVNQYAPQRIQIPFDVRLNAAVLGNFPASGSSAFNLTVNLLSNGNPVTASSASTQIEFLAGADPYFTNQNAADSNYPYLSQDLRVFTVTPGFDASPIPGVGTLADNVAGAYSYIQSVLQHFNDPLQGFTNPNGADPFTTVLPNQANADQSDSSVFPWTLDPFNFQLLNNYSFAIARVRLRGSSGTTGEAQNTRVFFRMFATQSNDTDYDPATTYAATPDAAGKPGSPLVGAGNTTFPMFATSNFPSQTDYLSNGVNNRTIVIPSGQDSVWAYYGCFLNLYDPNNSFGGQPLQALLPGTHHCLVAEIAFDDAPIPNGASPLAWDQLAQRNLQFTYSDNPGPAAAHRVPQTFDCRPSKGFAIAGPATVFPDELMIDWGRVPAGAVASLYWPQVSAAQVVALARQFYGSTPLSAADANTIRIPVTGGLSYIPIPAIAGQNFAGLFTVDLPASVRDGESYDITVKRIGTRFAELPPPPPPPPPGPKTEGAKPAEHPKPAVKAAPVQAGSGAKRTHRTHSGPVEEAMAAQAREPETSISWRYVIGTFQVHIPVSNSEKLLPREETTLAILKWRLDRMPPTNRWYPVLLRYVRYLAGRVDGMGGNAAAIPPSLTYVPPGVLGQSEGSEHCGKISEVLFDCHGGFDGFVLQECCETTIFRTRITAIGEVVLRACRDDLTVAVTAHRRRRDGICRIAIRR